VNIDWRKSLLVLVGVPILVAAIGAAATIISAKISYSKGYDEAVKEVDEQEETVVVTIEDENVAMNIDDLYITYNNLQDSYTSLKKDYDDLVASTESTLKTELNNGAKETEDIEETQLIQSIPADAVEFNGHYYKAYDDYSSWVVAESLCEDRGGYLATITSQEENDFIFTYTRKLGYRHVFFGLTDRLEEGVWKWVTEEEVSYTNWKSGYPENNDEDNYAVFHTFDDDSHWRNDKLYGSNIYYVCEWE